MRKKYGFLALVMCLLLAGGYAQNVRAGGWSPGIVSNGKAPYLVHLRKGPGSDTSSLGQLYSGVEVNIDCADGDWFRVSIRGKKGYIHQSCLVRQENEEGQAVAVKVYDARPWAVVNTEKGGSLNLRDRPTEDGSSYGKYQNGARVRMLGVFGDWNYVEVEGAFGYMKSAYLAVSDGSVPTPPPPEMAQPISGYATVNNASVSQTLRLYELPSEDSTVITAYANGTLLALLEERGDWYRVKGIGGEGFVRREAVLPDSEMPDLAPMDTGVVLGEFRVAGLRLEEDPTATGEGTNPIVGPGKDVVEILGRAGVYYRVRLRGQEGFTHTSAILPGRSQGSGFAGQIGVVSNPSFGDRLHLRSKPDRKSDSLGQYFNGTQVEILDAGEIPLAGWQDNEGWLHVRVCGQEGYMMAGFVSPTFVGEAPVVEVELK